MELFPALTSRLDGVALRVGDQAVTWPELRNACAAHRECLTREGVSPGERVGVWTQPGFETVVALVANAAAGFVTVPLDPKLGPRELAHVALDSQPRVTLAADIEAVEGRLPVPCLEAVSSPGGTAGAFREVDDAPLLVLYTSGTTGLPKGAVITARNVATNLDALADAWAWTADDTVVHALPLFHVHGLVLGLFGALRAGGALHWVPKFSAGEVAQALAARRSMLFAVPTMYHRLSEAAEADAAIAKGLGAARLLISGSAPLPRRDQQRIEALTGQRVLERYGLTETLINCAMRADGPRLTGYVGPPVKGVELRLVDDERRTIDARDDATLGEVAVRGPNVFAGYLNQPDATAAVMEDGWFFTGDLGCMRPDGIVRIVGRRATDLIKCGGFKVGAGEVEAALLEHPAVREAAVLGEPDPDLGERIVAFVVTSAPVEEGALEDHVARLLSPHKRPREVHVVAELPRNAMGKVIKAKLRDG